MAYDVNQDYSALTAALKKQKLATTDVAAQNALQAQIDSAEQSRTEKMASDLTTYGKYATDSELNAAAGIMATNQLGTGYDIQRRNVNTSFDNAKQNANNDALSRGMARSSFVSDRQANLDSERANALTQVDASKALAIQNAKANIIDNYRTNTANALANEKAEYADTQMTHYQDYQAEINNVLGDNDPTNDWQADKLLGWRNEKLLAQEAAALKAAKGYSGGTYSGGGGGGGATMTFAQLKSALGTMAVSNPDGMAAFIAQNGGQYADTLYAMYGLSGTPTITTPRTATYGSQTVSDVNDRINAGYTPQEVIAAAKEKYGVGSKEYNEIVSAALRQR